MSTSSTNISAVYLQGLSYENELNVILSIPNNLRGDVRSLAGNLEFKVHEIDYISQKKYPFVYMLDSWIKRVGAADATLECLHSNLIKLRRPDAAEIIQKAISDLQKEDPKQLTIIANRHNNKLTRSESNASLCPYFPNNSPNIADYPLGNSTSFTQDKIVSLGGSSKMSVASKDTSDAPTVYVVYVTEDEQHLKHIKNLVQELRKSRIDAKAEMFESIESSQNQGYYVYSNLIDAEYVLLICTSSFSSEKNEESSEDKKAKFILKLMLDFIYEHGPYNSKYIPILLPDSIRDHIPFVLKGSTSYDMSRKDYFDDLLRRIFKQEKYELAPLRKQPFIFKPKYIF